MSDRLEISLAFRINSFSLLILSHIIDFDTMIDLDLKYIANRSLWGDIVILCKTVLLIFPSEKSGAY